MPRLRLFLGCITLIMCVEVQCDFYVQTLAISATGIASNTTISNTGTTNTGLIPDVVLAQINAAVLPSGFTTITTANGWHEFISVTPGSTTTVKIGLN